MAEVNKLYNEIYGVEIHTYLNPKEETEEYKTILLTRSKMKIILQNYDTVEEAKDGHMEWFKTIENLLEDQILKLDHIGYLDETIECMESFYNFS